ncbi:putative urease accessory protein [Segniliparus rotundus DSM 44985]|uniref:Putative urease accessory protein n=1 Tax=Segniliparus rotundus (strain ATCC BAA-972 / CDC 1076 / CIP 108378 / DSM 44985 / JCM 13578) TaxID=640132 RepID=D6Z8F7_SEGRD|nr:urease accessory UreF family protein [Segniliparus rotundus]ADG98237.1 putative urease accessory protein [Segniliparus rotundus DSM 44985]
MKSVSALLLALADSRLPTGAHAHSGSMEEAIASGVVVDLDSAEAFLVRKTKTTSLTGASIAAHLVAGHCDLPGAERIADARTPSPAARDASREQGRGLARLAKTSWPGFDTTELPHRPHLTTVLGALGRHLGLAPGDVAGLFVYTAMSAAATAAQRLLALDPSLMAAATLRLSALCDETAERAAEALHELSDPLGDILAERHELRDQALFRS